MLAMPTGSGPPAIFRAARQAKSGNQPGDPAKAAQALLALVEAENPPVRLFLADDALGLVDQKLDGMRAEIAACPGPPNF